MSNPAPEITDVANPPRPVQWRNWPLGEGNWRIWAWLAIVAGLGWKVNAVLGSPTFGAGGRALAVCLWRLFLPASFILNPEGIEQRFLGRWRRTAWRRFRYWRVYPDGVYLWSSSDPAAELFQGLYLPLSPHRRKRTREKALQALRYYLGPPQEGE